MILTTDADLLAGAVEWVAAATASGKGVPEFCTTIGIIAHPARMAVTHYAPDWQRNLAIAGPGITLVATDRYRLHWATIPAEHGATERVTVANVPAVVAKATLKGILASRVPGSGLQARLDVDMAALSMTVEGWTTTPLALRSSMYARATTEGPPMAWDRLASVEGPLSTNPTVALSSTYLAAAATAVQKSVKDGRPIRLRLNDLRPMLIGLSIADDVLMRSGLLMPVRIDANGEGTWKR